MMLAKKILIGFVSAAALALGVVTAQSATTNVTD